MQLRPLRWIRERMEDVSLLASPPPTVWHRDGVSSCLLLPQDARLLFLLGYVSRGAVLELGPFCGCSSVQIARGMEAKRFWENRSERHRFFTADIFPAPPGSESVHRFDVVETKRVNLFLWGQPVWEKKMPRSRYQRTFGPFAEAPGGMLHCLYDIRGFVLIAVISSAVF